MALDPVIHVFGYKTPNPKINIIIKILVFLRNSPGGAAAEYVLGVRVVVVELG